MTSTITSSVLLNVLLLVAAAGLAMGVDKSKAMGPCVSGTPQCPPNLYCVENECYRKEDAGLTLMADEAAPSIGSCVNNLCPKGYDCIDNTCFKSSADGKMAIGPCINNKCPNGFTCNESDYKCYP